MSRPLTAGTARGSGSGRGAAGSRFSLVGWRLEGTGAGAGAGAAGSPHWRRWRATGAGAGSGWTGAGPSCTCHHAGSEASASGGGSGSLSSPRTGGSAAVARDARSAALRCARSSVARSSACLRFCAQSAAALDAFGAREDGRRARQRRGRVGRSETAREFGRARGGRPRAPSGIPQGRAWGRARRPDDHEARRGTVRHLERVARTRGARAARDGTLPAPPAARRAPVGWAHVTSLGKGEPSSGRPRRTHLASLGGRAYLVRRYHRAGDDRGRHGALVVVLRARVAGRACRRAALV